MLERLLWTWSWTVWSTTEKWSEESAKLCLDGKNGAKSNKRGSRVVERSRNDFLDVGQAVAAARLESAWAGQHFNQGRDDEGDDTS